MLGVAVVVLAILRPRIFSTVDSAHRPAAPPAAHPAAELPAPSPRPVDLAGAADLTQIAALVQRLRDAALKSDKLTREAMIQGLVKFGPAARAPVERAAASEADARALDAFAETLGRIP